MLKYANWVALIAMLTAPALTGCIPIVAGGLIYDNVANNENKAKFNNDFTARNMEREKQGLAPLDWCSEAYKAHRAWGEADKPCAERIKRYDKGDHTALTV